MKPSLSNPLLNATIEHLRRFAPFDQMESDHLAWLAQRLTLGYYAKGEVILTPDQRKNLRFLIIKQGVVQADYPGAAAGDGQTWLIMAEGECFPLGALLANRNVTGIYRASQDTFCYELAVEEFAELARMSPPFQNYCARRIAALLEQSKQRVQAQYAQSSAAQASLSSPLASLMVREPVTCTPDTPVRQVLQTMHDRGIGSMIVTENIQTGGKRPVGIFTLHDVLDRVALAQFDVDQPISAVMSGNLITMRPQAFAYEAAMVMARRGFRHMPVTQNEQLVGVISEKDLFALQRIGLRQIGETIRNAAGLDVLKQAAQDIRQLAHNMLAQGVAAEQLTQFISTLNDLLTVRIIELECAASAHIDGGMPRNGFCWIALGSEGRLEQTLNTDQDNGIIFIVPPGATADQVRAEFLPFAKRINAALAACGFPLCSGDVMASNPRWCLSLDEWKATFANWIDHGDPKALLYSSIFFDFRPLFGAENLALELREWLRHAAKRNSRFLHQMAINALRNAPPLGMVRDFVTDDAHTLDLKLNGITPFVDAARIFSLAYGGQQTNTADRLRELVGYEFLQQRDADAWIESFYFIQLLRLRLHHEQGANGLQLTNKVNPDQLNSLDRRILKESFRLARKLQTKLQLAYQV